MTALERRERILDILKDKKRISISELAKIIGISEVTIRRDIRILEKEGKILRNRGIVILPTVSQYELSFKEREKENADLKRKIAKIAYMMIKDGQTIALDASTTALQIAKLLINKEKRVLIVTPSLPIFNLLVYSKKVKVMLTGGFYDIKNLSFIGPYALRSIDMFNFDICFVSASAIIPEKGLFVTDPDGAEVIRLMSKNATKTVAIIDSSKFEKSANYLSVDIYSIDVLITDNNIKEKYISRLPRNLEIKIAN